MPQVPDRPFLWWSPGILADLLVSGVIRMSLAGDHPQDELVYVKLPSRIPRALLPRASRIPRATAIYSRCLSLARRRAWMDLLRAEVR